MLIVILSLEKLSSNTYILKRLMLEMGVSTMNLSGTISQIFMNLNYYYRVAHGRPKDNDSKG